jgi:hypothetical protein
VRPDDANPAPRGVLSYFFLQAGAIRTRFGETSRDDDGRADLRSLSSRIAPGQKTPG